MEFKTIQEKVCYGLGRRISRDFHAQKFEGFSDEALIAGFTDGIKGRELAVSPDDLNEAFNEFNRIMSKKQKEMSAKFREEGEKYLEANKAKQGVTVTESGLQYEILKQGDGERPGPKDIVRVKYKGSFINGEVFDSTENNDKGVEFPVNGVIAGWIEGLQLMSVGSVYRFVIPSNLAYGSSGVSGIPPESTLVFEVELLDIVMKSKEA
jgi:FKBP-type peptidyl-prolyl cis-trans isomerase FklB